MNESFEIPEREYPFKYWYNDPEQVENLILLMKETTKEDDLVVPQYTRGRIYQLLFPGADGVRQPPWVRPYERAPSPKYNNFRLALDKLTKNPALFGRTVPKKLVHEFLEIMRARHPVQGKEPSVHELSWTREKKVLFVGLMGYCGFGREDLKAFFGQHVMPISTDTIKQIRSKARGYPFDVNEKSPARQNATAREFVDTLRLIIGMDLGHLRLWVDKNVTLSRDRKIAKINELERRVSMRGADTETESYPVEWGIGRSELLQDAAVADIHLYHEKFGDVGLSPSVVKRNDLPLFKRARRAFKGKGSWSRALRTAGFDPEKVYLRKTKGKKTAPRPLEPLREPTVERTYPPRAHVFMGDIVGNKTREDYIGRNDPGFDRADARLDLRNILDYARKHGNLSAWAITLLESVVMKGYDPTPEENKKLSKAIRSNQNLRAMLDEGK